MSSFEPRSYDEVFLEEVTKAFFKRERELHVRTVWNRANADRRRVHTARYRAKVGRRRSHSRAWSELTDAQREKKRANSRKWRDDNREYVRAKNRRWRDANRDYLRAKSRQRYASLTQEEKRAQNARRYEYNHPGAAERRRKRESSVNCQCGGATYVKITGECRPCYRRRRGDKGGQRKSPPRASARALELVLTHIERECVDGVFAGSMTSIAQALGLGRSTVGRAVQQLCESELVERLPRGMGLALGAEHPLVRVLQEHLALVDREVPVPVARLHGARNAATNVHVEDAAPPIVGTTDEQNPIRGHTPTLNQKEKAMTEQEAQDILEPFSQKMAGTILAALHEMPAWREASGGELANHLTRHLQNAGYRASYAPGAFDGLTFIAESKSGAPWETYLPGRAPTP